MAAIVGDGKQLRSEAIDTDVEIRIHLQTMIDIRGSGLGKKNNEKTAVVQLEMIRRKLGWLDQYRLMRSELS